MIPTEPKIFFLGSPALNMPGVKDWLSHIGGEQALSCLNHVEGTDIEKLIELYARRCYKSYAPGLNPNLTSVRTDSEAYHSNIISQEHGSVTAHGHVHYAIEGVSLVFTHEIVRNSIGTERSQESLRYVRLTDIPFWIPPIILQGTDGNPLPPKDLTIPPLLFEDLYDQTNRSELTAQLTPQDIFHHVIAVAEWAQSQLASYYSIDQEKSFARKKALTSAFRRIVPDGVATGIGMSFAPRALRWILHQRTATSAEYEMRLVFNLIGKDALPRWPFLFQDLTPVDTEDGLFWYKSEHPKI